MVTAEHNYPLADRSEMLQFIPTDCRSVLDVGCAMGGFGRSLRQRFGESLTITGIEPAASQRSEAWSCYDEVLLGEYPAALANHEVDTFDCVVLLDVLEHMIDPWAALRLVADHLSARGTVVASIPNIGYLPVWLSVLRGNWEYTEAGILDRTHLRFFTRRSMVRMFEDAGYTIDRVQGLRFMEGGRKARMLKPFAPLLGDRAFLQFAIVARRAN